MVTVEFLAFALCAFYLMFLAVYLREYEEKEAAERERWMLETRDSSAMKELDAWRQSGRELSILRHDMRHFLRGLAVLIEEGRTDEALDRIDTLCEANDRTAVRRYSANETVNIALSSFGSDISKRGISADLRAAVPQSVHVADVDLFSVLSNALENAIDAASTAPRASALSILICGLRTGSCCFRFPTHLDGRRTWSTACPWLSTPVTALAPRALNSPWSA